MLNLEAITQKKYNRYTAEKSIAKLDQGEIDVLDQVREALGWPSIKSLAVKYYIVAPNRKWWLEALRRTRIRARRVNILYLLKTLQSVMEERLGLAFSGRKDLNRLIHKANNNNNGYVNRLVPTNEKGGVMNAAFGIAPALLARSTSGAF